MGGGARNQLKYELNSLQVKVFHTKQFDRCLTDTTFDKAMTKQTTFILLIC